MDTLTIEGIVPSSFKNQDEFYLQICDEYQKRADKFFDGIKTKLRSNSIAVRKREYVKKCKAGDRVRYTLKCSYRKNGIGTKAIGCEIL